MEPKTLHPFFVYAILVTIIAHINGRDIGTLIIGGDPAAEAEIPYQISIHREGGHQCGGALIVVNEIQLVITSAQCITPGFDRTYQVVAGELTRSVFSGHEQRRQVVFRNVHEDYNLGRMENDIALLIIDQPFDLNEWVQPIPLPTQGQTTAGEVLVSGWGDISTNSFELGRRADTLHKVQIPVIEDGTCHDIYNGRWGTGIPEMTICAGWMGGGRGICHADLGGPLRAIDGGYLAGIVSGGSPAICALRERPNVNTEVSHFVDWMQNQVRIMNSRMKNSSH